ncbi:class I poly(R)-hydroxyalkanoic acid synthase [Paracoccus contaminans]|uniref:Class I poly(R)-hydroxyalkanoic acid synthase n=1 Tax=Paracoccus contaminans TaxID=1945662 RepID=A0A1W6D0D8_9RHOB|nr:class I poly(R)-hydroxyalkanoic acid synthase [Paracoccus contaminans]
MPLSPTGTAADDEADRVIAQGNAAPSGADDSAAPAALTSADPAGEAASASGPANGADSVAAGGPESGAGGAAAAAVKDTDGESRANPLTVPDLPARLAENIERIETLGQRLLAALAARPMHTPAIEGPGPAFYGSVAGAWFRLAAQQPARIIEQQVRFWGQTLRHVAVAQEAFARNLSAPRTEAAEDRRFKNPLWQTNPFYSFVRNQYQINADALRQAAADLSIENDAERRRVEWFTRQMIDMLAPTNFLATNPDALQRAIETEGESLVRGLENLVRDIERGGGDLVVSLADPDAFQVGENIGATPGEVVHRTDLFELIQFAPATDQVHRTPVVVFPPWINKYYIMDLRPQNSLLRWIVDQGYTLFVVSWKNPRAEDAGLSMDDYVAAYLDVIGKVLDLTGEPQLNAVGYCIAGTTLSATLALMHQQGDTRVRSATFLTTLTDFSDQGEFTTFLQDDFVGGIEDEVSRTGYLSSQLMQRTFSFLRANDLVWGPAIRSYMMGETPPAFDLLYWNGDGTNLPGRMVTQYLRDLCQRNALAADGFEILGRRVHLSEVTLPLCAVACENDHIAPWLHSWAGVAQMGSPDKTFILSESGHVAGIINPPGRVKYGHYISDAGFGGGAEAWRAAAEFRPGSWWTLWGAWLAERSGEMIPARAPHDGLYPAPGRYVLEKA